VILLIDNYDSFTFNVYQYLCQLKAKVRVVRNDEVTLARIKRMRPEAIVISPGPGNPDQAGISMATVQEFGASTPILGICLGHQSIAQSFGGRIVRAPRLMHGKMTDVWHAKRGLFKGLPNPLTVTRYHSLLVERDSLPRCFRITAETEEGLIMGIRHKRYPIEGVQFHPESYMTQSGMLMLDNFLGRVRRARGESA
jgi:anthranilate synthase/aminodeoxychorismate synthase-like glutamine amidotransferase